MLLKFAILQIWVQCPHNSSGYYTIYGDDSSYQDHFSARLVTGNTGEVYARTGYLGFLRRTEAIGSDGGTWSILLELKSFLSGSILDLSLCSFLLVRTSISCELCSNEGSFVLSP